MHKKSILHIISIFALLLANIFLFKNPFIGAALFLLITNFYGFLLDKQNQKLGSILFILYLMSVGGAIYFVYQINLLISLLLLTLPIILLYFKKSLRTPELHFIKPKFSLSKVLTSALLIDLLLILFLFFKQTDQLLISPWQATNPVFFILFFISTCLLLYEGLQNNKSLPDFRSSQNFLNLSISVHLFLSFGVASILYKLGFGFDGFIHRATQKYIFENGFILPKQPFYLGQYALITILGHLTNIPIKLIDIYLVPISSAILLPISFKQLNLKNNNFALFSLLVPFIYFITLNLTTPHNIVILLTISGVLFAFAKNFKLAWAFAITAMLTHPLPGLPLFLFVLASNLTNSSKLNKYKINKILPASLLLITSLAPSLMFSLQNWRSGFGLPDLVNPIKQINKFIELFNKPYWYLKNAGFILDRLYDWQYIIGLVVILLGLYGLFINRKNKSAQITFAIFLGLWIGAWLLRSWIYFPNVASYEQGNYPLRLTNASILYLLPFMALALNNLYVKLKLNKNLYSKILVITSISGLLMISLYFSYPQRNHKARFPGYNVTAQDMDAVEHINNINTDLEYTVLSNPLVSISALTKYGFLKHFKTSQGELFYYAIPTGGPLYQLYGDMLYKGQKRETMIQAMDMMHVDKAYFVLNSYWGNSQQIKKGALTSSDDMFVIGEGENKVFIFTYYR